MQQPEASAGGVAVGTVVGETYQLVRLIGQGGMGSVWEAAHLRLPGKRVAVKVLQQTVSAASETFARFRREAEIASRLGHPNIVEVIDFNVLPSGAPYLVLELLAGENLAERLRRGPIPPGEALLLARQIGSALAAAHRSGVVHRDLKPENVFLCPPTDEGATTPRVKVLDFGISKIAGSSTVQTQETRMLGTPQYMAPEQARGQNSAIDARTDLFALGAIVYEMLGGHPAFSGENLAEIVFKVVYDRPRPLTELAPGASPAVVTAVERALAKEPGDRFPDVATFIEALTGRPLATVDRPAPDLTSPPALTPTPNRSQEAFAHTVASGDRPATPLPGPLPAAPRHDQRAPTEAYSSTVVLPDAKAAGGAGPAEAATRTETTAPRQRTGLWLGLGALLVGGAVVAVLAGRGGSRAPTPTSAGRSSAAPAAAPASPAEPAPIQAATPAPTSSGADAASTAEVERPAEAASVDAAPVVEASTPPADVPDAAVAAAAKPAPRRPDAGPATPPADDRDAPPDEDEGTARQFLDQAAAALAGGDAKEAVRLARRSLVERQTVRAYSIIARAYCAMGDLGNARAQLPHLGPVEKRRVVRACAKHGIDISP